MWAMQAGLGERKGARELASQCSLPEQGGQTGGVSCSQDFQMARWGHWWPPHRAPCGGSAGSFLSPSPNSEPHVCAPNP